MHFARNCTTDKSRRTSKPAFVKAKAPEAEQKNDPQTALDATLTALQENRGWELSNRVTSHMVQFVSVAQLETIAGNWDKANDKKKEAIEKSLREMGFILEQQEGRVSQKRVQKRIFEKFSEEGLPETVIPDEERDDVKEYLATQTQPPSSRTYFGTQLAAVLA